MCPLFWHTNGEVGKADGLIVWDTLIGQRSHTSYMCLHDRLKSTGLYDYTVKIFVLSLLFYLCLGFLDVHMLILTTKALLKFISICGKVIILHWRHCHMCVIFYLTSWSGPWFSLPWALGMGLFYETLQSTNNASFYKSWTNIWYFCPSVTLRKQLLLLPAMPHLIKHIQCLLNCSGGSLTVSCSSVNCRCCQFYV